ncbi:ATP-binding cassette domain-containing protein [Aureimonas flava]|uniref:ATP-binding cassette domain-containing protein n=1 Tax=Aureimonas flava TaxID=2320271 RepID=A0A3A1WL40_9HYPH|nr:ATP-binding cassette domain-containing protein [Aureimonas flava]RIY02008.1 ATP-binding cassette domain-containing protein [Aureimonas flava]
MIRLENVTKSFPGTAQAAVTGLDFEIETGTTVALIGPSGCGKTTTMRMINRLEVPTSGRILIDGRDVATSELTLLRRNIGYVIQHVGLFPHMTIARNVAAVPRLLGWDKARTDRRVDELLHLVGLDPATMRARLPHELSGGQRQRVGFARALAADPDIMLMDEPFGAIDPITRVRLQDEFKEILRAVRKTVVIVTHDLDEAIKMGDRVAVMRDGRLLQYDTPDAILARPADFFVESFLGPDRAIRRLALRTAGSAMGPRREAATTRGSVDERASLHLALSLMLADDLPGLTVTNAAGDAVGYLERESVVSAARTEAAPV